jgi:hypothetical protein
MAIQWPMGNTLELVDQTAAQMPLPSRHIARNSTQTTDGGFLRPDF